MQFKHPLRRCPYYSRATCTFISITEIPTPVILAKRLVKLLIRTYRPTPVCTRYTCTFQDYAPRRNCAVVCYLLIVLFFTIAPLIAKYFGANRRRHKSNQETGRTLKIKKQAYSPCIVDRNSMSPFHPSLALRRNTCQRRTANTCALWQGRGCRLSADELETEQVRYT